jgi:DNA mismatch endonuclease Vsr
MDMSLIKGKDTVPELLIEEFLKIKHVMCERNVSDVFGKPDFMFKKRKAALFVDGAFWHGHPAYYNPGKCSEFWDRKIARNIARDKEVDAELLRIGISVFRVWDFEVVKNALRVSTFNRIVKFVKNPKDNINSNNDSRPSLRNYFMDVAYLIASRSSCPSGKQHGAVITSDSGYILSTGYNGPARKKRHCETCSLDADSKGKDWRTCPAVHSEENAIANAAKNGSKIDGAVMYVTKKPCDRCARIILNSGIREVIFEYE